MQENTNKAIAFNSLILYTRLTATSICALFSTRFGLQALGAVDYGLFALLGGVIAVVTILNNIMVSTSNRFIAIAIGKGNIGEANKQFNVNLSIHITIALFVLAISYPVGNWYIHRYINYNGPLENAMMVYCITILGSIISFISIPYHGLLMAKEKFIVFSGMDVFSHFMRLLVTWLLLYHFSQKLLIYTLAFAVLHALPTFFYMFYCTYRYPEIVKLRKVKNRKMYKNVFKFSSWIGVGALAHAGKGEGAAIVVNVFFDTVMNTAMGVASIVNSYVTVFALSVTQPMAPQITKSYAAGNKERTNDLLVMSTKYGFLLTLIVGAFFLADPYWILKIWLVEVPPYATIFLVLFVLDNIIMALNFGIQNIIFASGNIWLYQLCSSVLNILSVFVGYLVLRAGAPAYYLIVTYVIFSVIRFFIIQWVLFHTLKYDCRILWNRSYIPSLLVAFLFFPILFLPCADFPFLKILITITYLCLIVFFFGLNRAERNKLKSLVNCYVFSK